jgi:transcriptional regulator with XRE-family HTH domain
MNKPQRFFDLTQEEPRPGVMTGREFRRLRDATGMTRSQFGLAIGYTGNTQNIRKAILQLERGEHNVTPKTGAKARAVAEQARRGQRQ